MSGKRRPLTSGLQMQPHQMGCHKTHLSLQQVPEAALKLAASQDSMSPDISWAHARAVVHSLQSRCRDQYLLAECMQPFKARQGLMSRTQGIPCLLWLPAVPTKKLRQGAWKMTFLLPFIMLSQCADGTDHIDIVSKRQQGDNLDCLLTGVKRNIQGGGWGEISMWLRLWLLSSAQGQMMGKLRKWQLLLFCQLRLGLLEGRHLLLGHELILLYSHSSYTLRCRAIGVSSIPAC